MRFNTNLRLKEKTSDVGSVQVGFEYFVKRNRKYNDKLTFAVEGRIKFHKKSVYFQKLSLFPLHPVL